MNVPTTQMIRKVIFELPVSRRMISSSTGSSRSQLTPTRRLVWSSLWTFSTIGSRVFSNSSAFAGSLSGAFFRTVTAARRSFAAAPRFAAVRAAASFGAGLPREALRSA